MDSHPQYNYSDASSIPMCTECGSDNPRWIKLLPTVWICHLCSGVHRCLSVQNPVQNGVETPPVEEPNTGMVYSANYGNDGNEGNNGIQATEIAPPESDDLPPYSDEEESASDEATFYSDDEILIPAEALDPHGQHNNLISLEIVPLFDVIRDEDNESEEDEDDDTDDDDENKDGENEGEDNEEDDDDSYDDDQDEDGEEGEDDEDDSDTSDQEGDHDENGFNPDEESASDTESSDDDDDVPDLEPPMDERASHNNATEDIVSLDDIYGSENSEDSDESVESDESDDSEEDVFYGDVEDYFGIIFPECLEVVVEGGGRLDLGDEEERLFALYYDEMSSEGEVDFAVFAAKECSCDDSELPEEVFQAELLAIAEYEQVLFLQKVHFSG